MPNYDFQCPDSHVFEKFKPMSQSSDKEPCPTCGLEAERYYGLFYRKPEFKSYTQDDGTVITSYGQEKKEMRKRGEIDGRETPGYDAPFMAEARRRQRKKPVYFISKGRS